MSDMLHLNRHVVSTDLSSEYQARNPRKATGLIARMSTAATAVLLMINLAGCERGGERVAAPDGQKLVVSPSSASMAVGDTTDFDARVVDGGGSELSGYGLTWSVSDTAVGAVDGDGVVVAEAPANVTVTVEATPTSGNGSSLSSTADLSVTPGEVRDVSISPSSPSITVGDSVTLDATVTNEQGRKVDLSAEWSTSDPSVARVDSDGVLIGEGEGDAQVSASVSGVTDTAGVAVDPTPVASIKVSPGSVTLQEGETTQLQASVLDSAGNALDRTVSWSSSNTSIATVDPLGVVEGRLEGEATITAKSGDASGSATVLVQAVDAQLETINRHSFDNLSNNETWSVWKDDNLSIVTDESAPRSPSNVARARFPEGGSGGTEHDNYLGISFGRQGLDTLYVSAWIRYSSDWQGHDSGVNKILYILREGSVGGPVYMSAQGADSGSLKPQLRMQNSGESWSRVLRPNVNTTATVTRGDWHRWDVLLVMNTGGSKNGTAEWWLDGEKVGHYEDVAWVPEGDPHIWNQIKFQPVWGGVGDQLSHDQHLFVDQLEIRGK